MSQEIKRKIDEYNCQLEKAIDPTSFERNAEVEKIFHSIEDLQKQCKHHFVNGVCEFCYLEEK